MNPPAPLTSMVAVGEESEVPAIGFVVWYSVKDTPVDLVTLKLQWALHNLPKELLPSDPRALYLFKRAMRAQEGRVSLPDGRIMETDVRDVAEDADFCVYQIARVVKDEEQQVVDYPKAMRVVYNKPADEVTFAPLGGTPAEQLAPMEQSIKDYLASNSKKIDGRKVRAIVRRFIKDDPNPDSERLTGLRGENLRGKGGGVYFVKVEHKDVLKRLAEALDGLYPDEGAFLYMVPMADGRDERELIRRKHLANAKAEIDEAMQDVAKLLREDRKNAVRSDVRDYWFKKLRMLKARSEEYAVLLKGREREIEDAQNMLEIQMKRLVQR